MPERTGLSQLEQAKKCLAYTVENIRHAHPHLAFYTDGVMVDDRHDPELVLQDRVEEFNRYHKCVSIKFDDETLDGKRSLGGNNRYVQLVELLCLFEITDREKRAGLDLDALKSRFEEDVIAALRDDMELRKAAGALGMTDAAAHGLVVNPTVDGVTVDKGSSHPYTAFIIHVSFEFDRFLAEPTTNPGPEAPAEPPMLP